MSIQYRLLLVYALIFSVVYFLSSLVIYILPRNQLLAQIDGDLYSLAAELMTGNTDVGADGIIRMPLPSDLATLQTASTFLIIVNREGKIVVQSSNLVGFDQLLDPESLGCLLYTSPSPRDRTRSRMPSSA